MTWFNIDHDAITVLLNPLDDDELGNELHQDLIKKMIAKENQDTKTIVLYG